jgi:protein-S-isoprenylcysteine O-methyltransferase
VRSAAIVQLGRFHTPNVAVRADHQLRVTGLYRLVRHPSYLGALIAYLGFSLALGNWLSVVVIMSITTPLYLYRIHEEDAALLAAFGDPYRAYCARTKRLIPWVF